MYSKSSSAQVISTMLEGVTEIRASYSWTGVIPDGEKWQGNPIYIANSSVNTLFYDAIEPQALDGITISFYGSSNGTDLDRVLMVPTAFKDVKDQDSGMELLQFPYVIPVVKNGSESDLTSFILAVHLQ